MSIGNDIILCPICDGVKGNKKCPLCKGEGRTFTWTFEKWAGVVVGNTSYWKKRYEKALSYIYRHFGAYSYNTAKEWIEEEMEVEEIEHEGMVEDAKLRGDLRHDTP